MTSPLHQRLLAFLRSKTNDLGQALGRDEVLMEELSCTTPELKVALDHLERAGSFTVLTPLPFLAVKMKTWPNTPLNAPKTAPTAYSYTLSQSGLNRNSYRPQAGEADLLHEILATLGETDPAAFEKAIELYSPRVIRTALSRVRRAQGIRKSRTALFRHLLPRLARQSDEAA